MLDLNWLFVNRSLARRRLAVEEIYNLVEIESTVFVELESLNVNVNCKKLAKSIDRISWQPNSSSRFLLV